ncbi:MAG: hypothetical protein ACK5RR_00645 [Acidobacteriota bacterium]
MNQITPEEMAAIVREKEKATSSVVILAAGMAIWAGSVLLKGGYTTQPEHHAMWRVVALLPAFWGLVLLIIFRYSWTSLLAAVVMSVSGFYLAKAPTVPGYGIESAGSSYASERQAERRRSANEPELTFSNLPRANETKNMIEDEDEPTYRPHEIRLLLDYCRQIQQERGEEWTRPESLEDAPCTLAEMEERRAEFDVRSVDRSPQLARNQ